MITIANDQSIRTLMQNAGYDGSKIGYDSGTNTVTYDNRPFYKGGMNVNGTVFTDNPSFTQAHTQYQKTYGPGTIFTPQDNNVPYEQRLANYAQNPASATAELNRANQVLAYNQATGNNDADTVAHISRLQQIMAAQQPQQQGPNVNDLISQVLQRVNNPQPYDVYNSPEYKAAQAAEAYQSQQATRGAQEALGEAGFGRSTNLADRAQMIQNDANQRLLTQVVPQLIANHRAQDQQQLGNLTSLISPLLQQQQMANENSRFDKTFGLQEKEFADKQRQEHIDLARALSEAYGVNVDPKEDPALAFAQVQGLKPINLQQLEIAKQNAASQEKEREAMAKYREAEAARQSTLGNRQASTEERNAHNQEQQRLIDIWKIQGKAPAGIDGVPEGTKYSGQEKPQKPKSPTDYKTNPDFSSDYAAVQSDPNTAKLLNSNAQDFIDEYGIDGYLALRKAAKLDE